MDYKESKRINSVNYDVEIKEGKLYFSEYEDKPYGKNNGTYCDLKEFCEGKSTDAIRVKNLIRSIRGNEELTRILRIAQLHLIP